MSIRSYLINEHDDLIHNIMDMIEDENVDICNDICNIITDKLKDHISPLEIDRLKKLYIDDHIIELNKIPQVKTIVNEPDENGYTAVMAALINPFVGPDICVAMNAVDVLLKLGADLQPIVSKNIVNELTDLGKINIARNVLETLKKNGIALSKEDTYLWLLYDYDYFMSVNKSKINDIKVNIYNRRTSLFMFALFHGLTLSKYQYHQLNNNIKVYNDHFPQGYDKIEQLVPLINNLSLLSVADRKCASSQILIALARFRIRSNNRSQIEKTICELAKKAIKGGADPHYKITGDIALGWAIYISNMSLIKLLVPITDYKKYYESYTGVTLDVYAKSKDLDLDKILAELTAKKLSEPTENLNKKGKNAVKIKCDCCGELYNLTKVNNVDPVTS